MIDCLIELSRLALKILKTNMIVFHFKKVKPTQSFDIKTDDECIIQVDVAKCLGLTFDANYLRLKIMSRNVVLDS